ncbi:MAG: secretin and TonB N-terminal domain-containing protein [Candidatus Marinimicrobia bacterium]|nr:secretin and TonB N-terminal domain-containing protein [Candidatus Neomarinimicrobiota bacterium]MBL7022882.1 secretin and TonB N-terminal domain-containing protein [Candidatus Neomarinimicrobiota bacterium]MBL7109201.1 secretin and TonB N-terminal domain-containing protein [Candidatus Neomarinimicrobiota bacterium]
MKKILFVITFTALLFSTTDSAQTGKVQQSNTVEKKVTIHAEDSHIPLILSILAEESGYNIVTGPGVNTEEKLTLHLEDVPVDQAINLVVRAAGLSYEIVGNSILVAKHSKLREEVGITSHVITLQYANAMEVKELLVNISEQIEVDKSGNKLLIHASPKKIAEIKEIIENVDVPATQIMLEARLIEVSVSDEEKLGIDWAKLASLTTIIAENAIPPNSGWGSLVPGLGITDNGDGTFSQEFDPMTTGQIPSELYFQRIDPSAQIGFSRQLTAFDLTLDFLLKNNKAKVLTNSQIVTLNGREANISMVDVVPYILSSGGVGGQVQVQREEVGIKLNILPTVNSDGHITTTVTPEVSSIYDFIGPDRNIPWVKKRTSTTTIRVKDGHSIIIAGLLGADNKFVENKFPLLWRIPWLGKKLFTHTVEIENKTDLIIQITPTIVVGNESGIVKNSIHKNYETDIQEENEKQNSLDSNSDK